MTITGGFGPYPFPKDNNNVWLKTFTSQEFRSFWRCERPLSRGSGLSKEKIFSILSIFTCQSLASMIS